MLTNVQCKSAKSQEKSYKLYDEKGLYLEVMPNGSKYWRLKYRMHQKEKRLALGVYPEVSLVDARQKRDLARKQLDQGLDPSLVKKEEKIKNFLETENAFEAVAREWHDHQKSGWTPRHAKYVLARIEADLFPFLGHKPIHKITAPELLTVVRKIEARGAIDIAHRALQTSGQIFRYAIATGRAEHNIVADLKGALKVHKKENYARLHEKDLPEFLKKVEEYEGDLQTKLALKFLLLTFVRTTELRGARWDEFHFDKKEWHIPAERMKMRDKHIVPLSHQALAVLENLKFINGMKDHVFPNRHNPQTFISENTLLYAFYRMGYHSRATPHGVRATASTILNEHGFKPDVIERQLAHAERNQVRASYNHAQYLPERKDMMQWWANFLDEQLRKE